MIMDKGEICREYKAAKKKHQEITVLAELNACSNDDIKFILLTNGYAVGGVKSDKLIKRLKDAGYDQNGNKLIEVTESDGSMPDAFDGVCDINVEDFQTHESVKKGLPVEEFVPEIEPECEVHEVEIEVSEADLSEEEQPAVEYHKIEEPTSIPQQPTYVTLTVPESIAKILDDTVKLRLKKLEAEIKPLEKYLEAVKKEHAELTKYLNKEAI